MRFPVGLRTDGTTVATALRGTADKLAELIAKTSAGVPMAPRSWTIERYASHWLEDVCRPRLKPTSQPDAAASAPSEVLEARPSAHYSDS